METEKGHGINKQAYPVLKVMIAYLGILYTPIFIMEIIKLFR